MEILRIISGSNSEYKLPNLTYVVRMHTNPNLAVKACCYVSRREKA